MHHQDRRRIVAPANLYIKTDPIIGRHEHIFDLKPSFPVPS
jgi:hypothetical protein